MVVPIRRAEGWTEPQQSAYMSVGDSAVLLGFFFFFVLCFPEQNMSLEEQLALKVRSLKMS
jgi:hypothetical protein